MLKGMDFYSKKVKPKISSKNISVFRNQIMYEIFYGAINDNFRKNNKVFIN